MQSAEGKPRRKAAGCGDQINSRRVTSRFVSKCHSLPLPFPGKGNPSGRLLVLFSRGVTPAVKEKEASKEQPTKRGRQKRAPDGKRKAAKQEGSELLVSLIS